MSFLVPAIRKLASSEINDETIQKIVRKVSGYATTTPAEFVAETYKFLKSGQVMPKDVMTLYEKYGGPMV